MTTLRDLPLGEPCLRFHAARMVRNLVAAMRNHHLINGAHGNLSMGMSVDLTTYLATVDPKSAVAGAERVSDLLDIISVMDSVGGEDGIAEMLTAYGLEESAYGTLKVYFDGLASIAQEMEDDVTINLDYVIRELDNIQTVLDGELGLRA